MLWGNCNNKVSRVQHSSNKNNNKNHSQRNYGDNALICKAQYLTLMSRRFKQDNTKNVTFTDSLDLDIINVKDLYKQKET